MSIEGEIGLDLSPSMIDISILTKKRHTEAVSNFSRQYYISATLYRLLYEENDSSTVYQAFNYFRPRNLWNQPLPFEKLRPVLREKLQPYEFNRVMVEDIYQKTTESGFPKPVRGILLDQWSFVKERSSLLMVTLDFANLLQKLGIAVLDATNRVLDAKTQLVTPYRGMKWIVGLALSGLALKYTSKTKWATIPAIGGFILALWDP